MDEVECKQRIGESVPEHAVLGKAPSSAEAAGVQRAHKMKKQGFQDCQRARRETLYIDLFDRKPVRWV